MIYLFFFQDEMLSEGDHESWDEDMMMNENNENPLPVVRVFNLII